MSGSDSSGYGYDLAVSTSIVRTETVDDTGGVSPTSSGRSSKGGGKYTRYVVSVTADGCSWAVSKRYSEFRALHLALLDKPFHVKVRPAPRVPPPASLV